MRRYRIPAVHDREMPAIPHRLVLQLPPELSESRIEHRFSQLGFRKALDAQILDADAFVIAHEIGRDLVQKIASLIRRLRVDTRNGPLRLRPSLTAQLTARNSPLRPSQLPFRFPHKTGRGCVPAIREHRKVLQSQIHAHHMDRIGRNQRCVRHGELADQRDVPIANSVLLECGALRDAVNALRLADANATNFGNVDSTIADRHTLRNTEPALIGFPAFESGKPGALVEEVHIGPSQVCQNLLQRPASRPRSAKRSPATTSAPSIGATTPPGANFSRLPGSTHGTVPGPNSTRSDERRPCEREPALVPRWDAYGTGIPCTVSPLAPLLVLDVLLDDCQRRSTDS